jgi:hypothetical protein
MDKKYIIAVAIVITIWGAFMVYRQHKKKGDTHTYREKAYDQITEAAKKSPRAGLARMGKALNKYHKDNNAYPSTLMELYPKYLPNKSFIEEVDWYYEPRGHDFYLSKSATVGQKRIVASIDKSLRSKTETTVMVATPTPVPKAREVKKPKEFEVQRPEPSEPEPIDRDRLELAREEFLKALRQRQMDVTSVSVPEMYEARIISTVQPEILSIVKAEIVSGLESELSQRYLVWKDKNGVLGFSNVQYPHTDRLSIHAVGRWYNVKIPLPKGREPAETKIMSATEQKDPETIGASLGGQYLVWKDQQGTVGFGNGQYPATKLASVFHTDRWVSLKRPQLAAETSIEKDLGQKKGKSPEAIASRFSTQYLVWKDKHGTLGFGNNRYPERELASVYQTDRWVSRKRPELGTETTAEEDVGREQEAKTPDTIASRLGPRYLVWKDKHGTLGFGNNRYPERELASVYQTDRWVSVKKAELAAETAVEEDLGSQKGKSPEAIASRFSTQYLVWKDKNGTLGFGNNRYPETGDVSHIHVNGTWEQVKD